MFKSNYYQWNHAKKLFVWTFFKKAFKINKVSINMFKSFEPMGMTSHLVHVPGGNLISLYKIFQNSQCCLVTCYFITRKTNNKNKHHIFAVCQINEKSRILKLPSRCDLQFCIENANCKNGNDGRYSVSSFIWACVQMFCHWTSQQTAQLNMAELH